MEREPLAIRLSCDRGVALVIAVMAATLTVALGLALTLLSMTETRIATGYRDGSEARAAAEGAIDLVMQELRSVRDWTPILNGSAGSRLVDAAPRGLRRLADGRDLDLIVATSLVNCNRPACSTAA